MKHPIVIYQILCWGEKSGIKTKALSISRERRAVKNGC